MRLLFITQDFPPGIGGIQTYSLEHASRLSGYCDDFMLICPGPADTESEGDWNPGFDVQRLNVRNHLLMLPLFQSLPGILSNRRFDTSFHSQWQTVLPAIRARDRGLLSRVCVAAHARELLYNPYHYLPGLGQLYKRYRASLLQKVDHFFPVSDYTAGLLQREGVDPDKMTVVRNGTDPTLFQPMDASSLRASLGLEGKRVLLTVTRLVKRKGIDTVLNALAGLGSDFNDLNYLVVGAGPEEQQLKQLADRLGLASRVRFLGPVGYPDLPEYYNLSDLFVMSSRTDLPDVEGFGIVFLEANACKKPVIGTRSGGVPSAIVDGETGFIVPENSPGELREAIRTLLLQPEKMTEMGQRGRRRVEEEMNWDRLSGDLYERLELLERQDGGEFRAGIGRNSGELIGEASGEEATRNQVDSEKTIPERGGEHVRERLPKSSQAPIIRAVRRQKRVLMVAPYFLPRRRVGSMRPSRFAAHLPSYGWEPHVITLGSRMKLTPREEKWLEGVTVHRIDPGMDRTETPESRVDDQNQEQGSAGLLSGIGDFIDRHCPMDTWLLLFFKELARIKEIAIQVDADLVWSTGDPWSGHWLAGQLIQKLGLPWVADFRDPWTLGGVQLRKRSVFSSAADRKLERSFLTRADRVTFTAERTREIYLDHYPGLSGRSLTITNSFDRSLMQGMKTGPCPAIDPDSFSILFFGKFRQLSPAEPLIRILHRLRELDPAASSRIKIYSTGSLEGTDERLAERLGVSDLFHTLDPVPPERGPELLKQADLLLLSTDPRREHIIPAKLWDYLTVDRPILSIAPNPDIDRILKSTGAGLQISPSETEKLVRFLSDAVRAEEEGREFPILTKRDEAEIAKYESGYTTGQLARLFDTLDGGR